MHGGLRPGGRGPAQIAVFAALGVILLLLGVRAIRGTAATGSEPAVDHGLIAEAPIDPDGARSGAGDLVVHVAGAVRKPGVYRVPVGSRVAEAIERAGGPAAAAASDAINLAARLADGQQVVLPSRETSAGRTGGDTGPGAGAEPTEGPISLGSATAAELETIAGIGPVTAANIIAFRDQQGGIGSIEDLDAVPGIGPATLEALAERLQP